MLFATEFPSRKEFFNGAPPKIKQSQMYRSEWRLLTQGETYQGYHGISVLPVVIPMVFTEKRREKEAKILTDILILLFPSILLKKKSILFTSPSSNQVSLIAHDSNKSTNPWSEARQKSKNYYTVFRIDNIIYILSLSNYLTTKICVANTSLWN
jgi:hypothetical protein